MKNHHVAMHELEVDFIVTMQCKCKLLLTKGRFRNNGNFAEKNFITKLWVWKHIWFQYQRFYVDSEDIVGNVINGYDIESSISTTVEPAWRFIVDSH